jgi:hypothetical protein
MAALIVVPLAAQAGSTAPKLGDYRSSAFDRYQLALLWSRRP